MTDFHGFAAALQGLGVACLVFDRAGRVALMNPVAAELTGWPPEQALGRPLADVLIADDGDQPEVAERMVAEVLPADGARDLAWSASLLSRSGAVRPVTGSTSPLFDGDSVLLGGVLVFRDETKANELHYLESVVRPAAFDIGQLLTVILGHTEVLLHEPEAPPEVRDDLTSISQAACRLAEAREQLMVDHHSLRAAYVLSLNQVVAASLSMLRRLCGQGVVIDCELAPGLGRVQLHPAHVRQILGSLCANARDAHATKITITTSNVRLDEGKGVGRGIPSPGDHVMLEVCDDGCGIDEDRLRTLFGPFAGRSLGDVFHIVDRNYGSLQVDTAVGQGTRMRVYLPQAQAAPPIGARDADAEPPLGHGETVLAVDCEPDMLDLLGEALKAFGYSVLAAASSEDALALVAAQPRIDLLVAAVRMPGMGGVELYKHLRRSLYPLLRCVLTSGHDGHRPAPGGKPDDAIPFLLKPFGINQLAVTVRDVIDHG